MKLKLNGFDRAMMTCVITSIKEESIDLKKAWEEARAGLRNPVQTCEKLQRAAVCMNMKLGHFVPFLMRVAQLDSDESVRPANIVDTWFHLGSYGEELAYETLERWVAESTLEEILT